MIINWPVPVTNGHAAWAVWLAGLEGRASPASRASRATDSASFCASSLFFGSHGQSGSWWQVRALRSRARIILSQPGRGSLRFDCSRANLGG